MKTVTSLIFTLSIFVSLNAQQTINATITHDGLQREYILYVPANYNGSTEVPLLLNFHGYTSDANSQMWYGDFRSIADTAGFIIAHPEGTLFQGSSHWNVGAWTVGSTVNDVGFTAALIDTLSAQYAINANRIYSTGMSNGGYMSFLLACELGDRITAIASVTGSMTTETYNDCSPSHPTPILQIHGTTDPTVPYGGSTWTKSIEDVIDYWVSYNTCNPAPITTNLPDVNTLDLSTVTHTLYSEGDQNSTVEHYKVIGGGHTWPGTTFPSTGTNYDFNASAEIWRFFSQYSLDQLTGATSISEELKPSESMVISPNPSNALITLSGVEPNAGFTIRSITGQVVLTGIMADNSINISSLSPAIYLLEIDKKATNLPSRNRLFQLLSLATKLIKFICIA